MMDKNIKKVYDKAVDILLEGIHTDYANWSGSTENPYIKDIPKVKLYIKPGRKFDKVVRDNSVWGFIAKTDGILKGIPYFVGDVFKAAGWRAPAKHVRGSIFDYKNDWFQWTCPNYLI